MWTACCLHVCYSCQLAQMAKLGLIYAFESTHVRTGLGACAYRTHVRAHLILRIGRGIDILRIAIDTIAIRA